MEMISAGKLRSLENAELKPTLGWLTQICRKWELMDTHLLTKILIKLSLQDCNLLEILIHLVAVEISR